MVGGRYRLPGLGAAFAARYLGPGPGAILDAGCSTGLVGDALSVLVFGPLVGADISDEKLARVRACGVYSRVYAQHLGQPLPELDDTFTALVCIGALGPGNAPPSCFAEFIRVVRPGGHVILSTRPGKHMEWGHVAAFAAHETAGRWREVKRSRPFRAFLISDPELVSQVFVFQVT